MSPAFGSDEFLTLPRKKQNDLIFTLLAPLARFDFEREVEWLRGRRDEVTLRLNMLEKIRGSLEQLEFEPSHGDQRPITQNHEQKQITQNHEHVQVSVPPEHVQVSVPPDDRQEPDQELYNDQLSPSTLPLPVYTHKNSLVPDYSLEESEEERMDIAESRNVNKKVVLNVGGVKHEVMWRMLERQPRSRLGLLSQATTSGQVLELCDAFSLDDNEYYFDRHPRTFNCILNFYRTGKLHMMDEFCVVDFSEDLDYWMIDDLYLEACCEGKYSSRREHVAEEVIKNSKVNKVEEVEEDFGDGPLAKYQKCLWDLMEKPASSICAKILSLFSISLVLISTLGMCLNTMPEFKDEDENGELVENPHFAFIEAICISWFTIEYFLRLAGSPDKWKFVKGTLNVIDVLAILPYYLSLAFLDEETKATDSAGAASSTVAPEEEEEMSFDDMSRLIQVFRIARIMRIFKLARSSSGLQAMAHTMKSSYKELCLLLLFVGMGMLIFGSLCYFVEKEAEDTLYSSIPESMWWAIQTMTSVGYGDLYPTTILGKLIGSCCGVSGVLVMALPIPIVVENFGAYYMEQKKREQIAMKKEALANVKVEEAAARVVVREGLVDMLYKNPGPFSSPPGSPGTTSPMSKLPL